MKKLVFATLLLGAIVTRGQTVRVGAKHFNEGYIVSELIAQLLEHDGFHVERVYNLGGTLVCFEALRNNAIDLYPEYTGTIALEILKSDSKIDAAEIQRQLHDQFHMMMSDPIGFNNSYGFVVRSAMAKEKEIYRLSDLQRHPELTIGLSYEFLKRKDGWENLSVAYGLKFKPVALEHGLA